MFRRVSPFYLFAAGLLTAPLVSAQTPDAPRRDQGSSNSSGQEHLSSSISQAIREKLPAYTAPEEKKAVSSPEAATDAVVLEQMVIRGAKPRVFTERELATKTGLDALLRKRYPGASPPIKRLPNYAMQLLADDERLAYIAELDSVAADLHAVGDSKASKELKKEISRSFMRRTDWRTEGMDRSANNNRR